jgi:hypothetical protein
MAASSAQPGVLSRTLPSSPAAPAPPPPLLLPNAAAVSSVMRAGARCAVPVEGVQRRGRCSRCVRIYIQRDRGRRLMRSESARQGCPSPAAGPCKAPARPAPAASPRPPSRPCHCGSVLSACASAVHASRWQMPARPQAATSAAMMPLRRLSSSGPRKPWSSSKMADTCRGGAQYSAVQYSTVQYSTVQYSTVQYSTVQYSAVQYSKAPYSAVWYGIVCYAMLCYAMVWIEMGWQLGWQWDRVGWLP